MIVRALIFDWPSINFGDGNTSTGTLTYLGTETIDSVTVHQYSISGSDTFAVGGTLFPQITITGNGAATNVGYAEADVAGISASAVPVNTNTTTAISGAIVANFSDTMADAGTVTYSASVAWNGGSPVTANVVPDGNGGFNVVSSTSSTYTFSTAGSTYTPVIVITPSDTGLRGAVTIAGSVDVTNISSATGSSFTVDQGANYTGAVATFADSTDTNAGHYGASIDWGDGNVTDGHIAYVSGVLTVTEPSGSPFAYAEAGIFNPVVTLTDHLGGTTTASVGTATVNGITFTAGDAITATQGSSASGVTLGTFTDTASGVSDYPSSYYIANIDWGDGSSTSTGSISDPVGGVFTVTGTHTYSQAGTYYPTVTITSLPDGSSGAESSEADVTGLTASGYDINAIHGTDFTGVIANFTDPAATSPVAGDYAAALTWGTSSSASGTIASDGNGGFNVSIGGSGINFDGGVYDLTVTITKTSDSRQVVTTCSVNSTMIATVTPASTLTKDQKESFTSTAVATFTVVSGASTDPDDYSAWVDWGDGNTSPATIAYSSGTFTVSAENDTGFLAVGDLTPIITITDPSGATNTAYDSATVNGLSGSANDIYPILSTSYTAGAIATFQDAASDAGTVSHYALANWGDNTTSAATVSGPDGDGNYTVTITGSKTFGTLGQSPITIAVWTNTGRRANLTATAYISNLTPTSETITATMGDSFSDMILATFVNPGAGTSPTGYTASIDWGDGNTSNGSVDYDGTSGHDYFTISGGNSFNGSGTFNPTITLIDPGGNVSKFTTTADVAAVDTPSITSGVLSLGLWGDEPEFELTLSWTGGAADNFEIEGKNPDVPSGNFQDVHAGSSDLNHGASLHIGTISSSESGGVTTYSQSIFDLDMTQMPDFLFRIRADNGQGAVYSSNWQMTPDSDLNAPSLTQATGLVNEQLYVADGDGTDTFDWQQDIYQYESSSLPSGWTPPAFTGGVHNANFIISQNLPSATYRMRSLYYDSEDNVYQYSDWSSTVDATYSNSSVNTPTLTTTPATVDGVDGVDASWSWTPQDGQSLEWMNIYALKEDGHTVESLSELSTNSGSTFIAADPGSTIMLQVHATSDSNQWSTMATAAGPSLVAAAPAAPDNLTANFADGNTFDLLWRNIPEDETGFQVEYRLHSASTWTLYGGALAADITFSTVTLPTAVDLYDVAVYAINGALASDAVSTTASVPRIYSLTFSGSSTIYRDAGAQAAYSGPQWEDGNGNGTVDVGPGKKAYLDGTIDNGILSTEIEFPIAYPVGTTQIDLSLDLEGTLPSGAVIEGFASDGTHNYTFTKADDGSYVATVDFTTIQSAALSIMWAYTLDSGASFHKIERTSNHLFVYGNELGGLLGSFETVLWLGCEGANNKTPGAEDSQIRDGVWAMFSKNGGQYGNGADPTSVDGKKLYYWGATANANFMKKNNTIGFTVSDLLRDHDGYCNAWQGLLADVFTVEGLTDVSDIGVSPIQNNIDGYLISGINVIGGLSSQGSTGIRSFSNHALVAIGNRLYDPSYGTLFVGKNFAASRFLWEDYSVESYNSVDFNNHNNLGILFKKIYILSKYKTGVMTVVKVDKVS